MSEFFEATIAKCRICGATFCPQDGGPECDCAERMEEQQEEDRAMFILLNWSDPIGYDDISVVMKDDDSGEPLLFNTEEEAGEYAEVELNWYWVAVELR
jgi:hypothetical protein